MKKCVNYRARRENLDLSRFFFFKNWTNQTKRNVLKIIPYFTSAPCVCVCVCVNASVCVCVLMRVLYLISDWQ